MFYNCDLETIAKQAFADHLWQNENPDPSWIKGKVLTQCGKTRNSLSLKKNSVKSIVTSLVQPLLSRNFCQCVRVNFRNFHTGTMFTF